MCELLRHDTIKAARKQHVCFWCGEAINVGDSYVRSVVKGDFGGSVDESKLHPECDAAWGRAAAEERGCYYADFGEHERGGTEPR